MSDSKNTRKSEEDFLKRLLETFKVEADEHIKAISSGLLELEQSPGEEQLQRILEAIYRQAHSLKGAARAVELSDVETICQSLESIFKDFKYKGVPASTEMFDILQRAVNTIDLIVSKQHKPNMTALLKELELVRFTSFTMESKPPKIEQLVSPDSTPVTPKRRFQREGYVNLPAPAKPEPPPELPLEPSVANSSCTIRVASEKIDRLLLQAEEMIFMKLATQRRLTQLQEIAPVFRDMQKKESTLTAAFKSIQANQTTEKQKRDWKKVMEYFQFNRGQQKELQGEIDRITKSLRSDFRLFNSMIDIHLADLRQTLMLPFATLTEGFPRMVRELARQKGKEVELVLTGNHIEIDKRILEAMKAPLLHLVRNALDHGIESPQERLKNNKPQCGLLQITITQKENNNVEITVSDDGAGIPLDKIKDKALELGLYKSEEWERLSAQEKMAIIFLPEFSTSPIITDISGRGLGLAIVREATDRLGGRIAITSIPGQGTTFCFTLRMSLATFRGILVEVATQRFIIPTLHVTMVLQVKAKDIKTVENRKTFLLKDELLSFSRLQQVLQLPGGASGSSPQSQDDVHIVVVEAGERRIGFQVDQVLNEEEVLVKELGQQLSRVKNIAGATILGSGEVVLILNPVDLIKSAILESDLAQRTVLHQDKEKEAAQATQRKKSILVVEDSITSRMLLKNILETAGYRVRVAVDGMDGWITIKEESFDLVVLDVEMPGLSGFELTAKIRDDHNLNRLPVVLVTALESREDREKGIDVGADAYIIKSSFDQSNLLEVVKKLV